MKYALITPARNEETFIAKTLESVVNQIQLPERWVVVDDGSTDRTAQIVETYLPRYPWIELIHRGQRADRTFAGKAHSVNAGLERLRGVAHDVVGNLDADVSFEPDYMQFIMQRFSEDATLGVAGTPFTEQGGYDSARDSFEGENYVAGPCQLFRARCFEEIGGYIPNHAGGLDWIAVMTARMKGWNVRSFDQKRFHHHRSLGTAERSKVAALFSYGEKDYYLGGSPIWELFRVTYRMAKPPFLVGGLALLAGFGWAGVTRTKRAVSPELMRFHRRDQMRKLRSILGSLFRFRKVDSFRLATAPKR